MQILRHLTGRTIRGITKRIAQDRKDMELNIDRNDEQIAKIGMEICRLGDLQRSLQAENTTAQAIIDSVRVM